MLGQIKILIVGIIAILSASAATAQSEYKVRTGDTLIIEVLEDESLNRALVVLSDGRISFPFAGTVSVAGRTVGQVESAITSAIASNFAAEPNVFVSVQPEQRQAGSASGPTIDVYFLGEVNEPGLREVAPGTNLLQAMSLSGGMTRFAAQKRVQLRRAGANGQQSVFLVNYRAILDGAQMQSNVTLQDGDVIVVPERRLFE